MSGLEGEDLVGASLYLLLYEFPLLGIRVSPSSLQIYPEMHTVPYRWLRTFQTVPFRQIHFSFKIQTISHFLQCIISYSEYSQLTFVSPLPVPFLYEFDLFPPQPGRPHKICIQKSLLSVLTKYRRLQQDPVFSTLPYDIYPNRRAMKCVLPSREFLPPYRLLNVCTMSRNIQDYPHPLFSRDSRNFQNNNK